VVTVIDFFGNLIQTILAPLEWLTSAILVFWHKVFADILHLGAGPAWVLSIICLTLVIRTALIPLFVKQIKNSRNLQLLQPKVRELQKKYGHDRERLTQETMKLYKETGTNPLASCLPLLLQMPIFLALFRTLRSAADNHAVGVLTSSLADSLATAKLFGVRISDSFTTTGASSGTKWFTGFLVLAMTATTFTTQRQLMRKNMPESALTGQYAQQQKLLLYILPVVFAVGGIAFPVGVLLYWTTSNMWTMGQQFYVIRNNPTPGTPAFEAKKARDAAKAQRHGETVPDPSAPAPAEDPPPKPAPRVQPKKQSRSKRKRK
jgi:YidC/Oxa1 family membrane protein insertase